MSGFRARVEQGRLILDEPTTLPEGTVVELVVDDEGDDLSEEERRRLHDALSASWKSAEAGRLSPVSAIVEELRNRRESPGSNHPRSRAQIRAIDRWWRRNRTASPDLLINELSEAFDIVGQCAADWPSV